MNKITILGSGTSTGVPILGCNCRVCKSTDLRNKRLRTSALIETAHSKKILIDASPDLRAQLLRTNTTNMDAVIITHDHADHTHGMDDLRPLTFNRTTPLEVYTEAPVAKALEEKFPYIFQREKIYSDRPIIGGGIPLLDLMVVTEGANTILGEEISFFTLPHGYTKTLCLLHHKMAYVVDCQVISQPVLKHFRDAKLEVLIIDCLRFEPHQTHLHVEKALDYVEKIAPTMAVLTHMGHELEYLELMEYLERRGIKNVFPAIDGQSFLYS